MGKFTFCQIKKTHFHSDGGEEATDEVFANLMLFNLKGNKQERDTSLSRNNKKNSATAKIAVNSIRLISDLLSSGGFLVATPAHDFDAEAKLREE